MEKTPNIGKLPILFLLKSLLLAYALTGALLGFLAFLLYRFGFGERVVALSVIVIYVAAAFFAGFLAGKKMKSRKFLWGLLEGASYFLVLVLFSLLAGERDVAAGGSFLTTLALCVGGGMLGGMMG